MRPVVFSVALLCACTLLPACPRAHAETSRDIPPTAIRADWQAQDGTDRGKTHRDAFQKLMAELGESGLELRALAGNLFRESPPATDMRWTQLYYRACTLRRQDRLRALLDDHRKIVFTKHYDLGGSHYAYTEGQSDAQNERHFTPGASLCMLHMDNSCGNIEILLEDPTGVIRDPDVSQDGTRVLFAWKKSLNEDDYHLYEMTLADRSIRQLTFGLGFADYEGAYLPNGDIVFNSTRCVQTVDCWWTEVSNLYTCDKDGRFLRRLSNDQVHTNYPTVTRDGRVIYTRWDYNDRGQIYPQGLFQMHPDGTYQTEFYGNNSWFPTSVLHARNIPGSTKVVGIFSGHHCIQKGWLGILDPAMGRQENAGARLIAPCRATEAVHIDAYGQDGNQFQYPYPLSETEFIVGFKPSGATTPFRIYWMDVDGHRELLAWDDKISCNQPILVGGQPMPHERPSLVDYRKDSGTFLLQDVYQGPGLAGIPRGTIKKLRVVALDYRAAGIGYNTNKGPAGGALASTPVSIEGSWDVKVVLGTATVFEDGSACFNAPANTPVYFQALDANNEAVQTMRSWAQLQPGEAFSCVGCHESKNSAPPPMARSLALKAGPQALENSGGAPRGFSFEREIQPILDQNCVRCHFIKDTSRLANPAGPLPLGWPGVTTTPDPAKSVYKKKPDLGIKPAFSLQGAPGTWSPAYRALANRRVTNWINIQESPAMLPPYPAGAAKSPLMQMLRANHNGVQLKQEELDRIACWIDLLVPCFGDYTEGLSDEQRATYNNFLEKRKRWQAQEAKNIQELVQER